MNCLFIIIKFSITGLDLIEYRKTPNRSTNRGSVHCRILFSKCLSYRVQFTTVRLFLVHKASIGEGFHHLDHLELAITWKASIMNNIANSEHIHDVRSKKNLFHNLYSFLIEQLHFHFIAVICIFKCDRKNYC